MLVSVNINIASCYIYIEREREYPQGLIGLSRPSMFNIDKQYKVIPRRLASDE